MELTNIRSSQRGNDKYNHSLIALFNNLKLNVPTEFLCLTNGHNWAVGKVLLLEKALPNPPNGNAAVMLEDDVKDPDPGEALLDMGNTPKVGVG